MTFFGAIFDFKISHNRKKCELHKYFKAAFYWWWYLSMKCKRMCVFLVEFPTFMRDDEKLTSTTASVKLQNNETLIYLLDKPETHAFFYVSTTDICSMNAVNVANPNHFRLHWKLMRFWYEILQRKRCIQPFKSHFILWRWAVVCVFLSRLFCSFY